MAMACAMRQSLSTVMTPAAQHEIGGLGEGPSCENKWDKKCREKVNMEAASHPN
jgi:hypothetical protein